MFCLHYYYFGQLLYSIATVPEHKKITSAVKRLISRKFYPYTLFENEPQRLVAHPTRNSTCISNSYYSIVLNIKTGLRTPTLPYNPPLPSIDVHRIQTTRSERRGNKTKQPAILSLKTKITTIVDFTLGSRSWFDCNSYSFFSPYAVYSSSTIQ